MWFHSLPPASLLGTRRIRPGVTRAVAVAELRISERTAEKLRDGHGVDADDVRDAVENVPGLRGNMHFHPQRGWRMLLAVQVRGESCRVVLYPTDADEVWNLGTAYPL